MSEKQLDALYLDIAQAGDVEAAVRGLSAAELRELRGYLSRLNVQSGVPGMICGLVHDEAAQRFFKQGGKKA